MPVPHHEFEDGTGLLERLQTPVRPVDGAKTRAGTRWHDVLRAVDEGGEEPVKFLKGHGIVTG